MSILSEVLGWIIKRTVCQPLGKGSGGLRNENGLNENKSCQINNFISSLDTLTSQGHEVCMEFRSLSPECSEIRWRNANCTVIKLEAEGWIGVLSLEKRNIVFASKVAS